MENCRGQGYDGVFTSITGSSSNPLPHQVKETHIASVLTTAFRLVILVQNYSLRGKNCYQAKFDIVGVRFFLMLFNMVKCPNPGEGEMVIVDLL